MKAKSMKLISAVLAGIMTTAMLAGCTGAPAASGSSGTPSSTAGADSGSTASTGTSGEVATISILSGEAVNMKMFKMSEREKYPVWAEFEKHCLELGLKFEFELVPYDQYAVIAQTRAAAANKLPDMMAIGTMDIPSCLNLGKGGIIQPLNDIIANYSDGTAKAFYGKGGPGELSYALSTDTNGNVYWFSSVGQSTYKGVPMATSMTVDIRKDWLEKLNIAEPKTAEEFLTALKTFREKDANGNGLKDEVLIAQTANFNNNGIAQWFGLVNGTTAVDNATKKVVSPWYQEGIKDYFIYMNRLYKEKLLDPSATEDQANSSNAMAAIYSYATQTWLEPATGDPNAAYLPLPPLAAKEGITPIQIQGNPTSAVPYSKYAFTKNCTNKEAMGKILDLVTSDYYREITEWGLEGINYKRVDYGYENLLASKSNEDHAKDGTATGYQLWGFGPFPRMAWGDEWEYYLEKETTTLPDYKCEYQKAACQRVIDKFPIVYVDVSSSFALPTDAELERTGKISTDLQTYSDELSTKLVIGEASLDNWDTYIAELKELGLDELIQIQQAQYERFQKALG